MKTLPMIWKSVLALVVFAGLPAAPGWIIFQHERILRSGTSYRFIADAYDPGDVLRGRYLRVRLRSARVLVSRERIEAIADLWSGRTYATLRRGPDGTAEVTDITKTPPKTGDYVECTVRIERPFEEDGTTPTEEYVTVWLKTDRYYVNENEAMELEARHIRAASEEKAWAEVRVLGGRSVIERLHYGVQ